MKQNLITDVVQEMLPYLNNAQMEKLQEVLVYTLFKYEVTECEKEKELSEQNLVELFLGAKRIEGCSEKSLKYYESTIKTLLDDLKKDVKYIVTDDIYLVVNAIDFLLMLFKRNTSGYEIARALHDLRTHLMNFIVCNCELYNLYEWE